MKLGFVYCNYKVTILLIKVHLGHSVVCFWPPADLKTPCLTGRNVDRYVLLAVFNKLNINSTIFVLACLAYFIERATIGANLFYRNTIVASVRYCDFCFALFALIIRQVYESIRHPRLCIITRFFPMKIRNGSRNNQRESANNVTVSHAVLLWADALREG